MAGQKWCLNCSPAISATPLHTWHTGWFCSHFVSFKFKILVIFIFSLSVFSTSIKTPTWQMPQIRPMLPVYIPAFPYLFSLSQEIMSNVCKNALQTAGLCQYAAMFTKILCALQTFIHVKLDILLTEVMTSYLNYYPLFKVPWTFPNSCKQHSSLEFQCNILIWYSIINHFKTPFMSISDSITD